MIRKALISGITGQDGSYLAEFLLEKGYEVHGIKRRSSLSTPPASITSIRIRTAPIPSELYGLISESPQSETTAFHPRSHYAVAKLYTHWITVNYREAYGLYACNGILFNHESPRRGKTFVTRKITRGLANIAQGLEDCLYMGSIHALRAWGDARDYVRMQWLMLQQDSPEDFVIATGEQHSVRQFIEWAASDLGIRLRFEGSGHDERAVVEAVTSDAANCVNPGQVIMRIDKRYYRAAEVNSLLGNSRKAREKLGWAPTISARELCSNMVQEDLRAARQQGFLTENGLGLPVSAGIDGMRIFLAGHCGMVGKAMLRQLQARSEGVGILTRPRAELDLTDQAGLGAFWQRNDRMR